MSSQDKFYVQDNGHINMRSQTYSHVKKNVTQIQMAREKQEVPGPGSYDTTRGVNVHSSPHKVTGGLINPVSSASAVSPGKAAAAGSNPSLQKMSVPSIPSRFLTPVIDGSTQKDSEICKINRLVDDPGRLGPGTYELNEELTKKTTKNTIAWGRERTARTSMLVEPLRKTGETVGPGSYSTSSRFYKPQQPFFARSGLRPVNVGFDRGTIRANFEMPDDSSDDEDEMSRRKAIPGPGAYQTTQSSFTTTQPRATSFQFFGSTSVRFNEKPIGTNLGPGQYQVKMVGRKHNSALEVAGSAPFKSQKRPDIINRAQSVERPAPGSYDK